MRGQLLSHEIINSLVNAGSIKKFLELLSNTPYEEKLKKLSGTKIDAATLEKIFYQEFIDRLNRITRVAPVEIRDFFKAYYFMKLEIQNLKRVFRGKFSKTAVTRIKKVLIPTGSISPINFDSLAEAETLEASVPLLKDTIYAPITEALSLCGTYDAIWPIEIMLNSVYVNVTLNALSKLPEQNRRGLRRIIEAEADIENLLLAITWRKSSRKLPSVEEFFQHTYKISKEEIEKTIASKDLAEFLKNLKPPYAEIVRPITSGEEAMVRTNLRRYIYNEASKGKVVNDFGFTSIMSYLVSCEIERGNLISIAWGIENKVKIEKISRYIAVIS